MSTMTSSGSAKQHAMDIQQAKCLFQKGDLTRAERICASILQNNPYDPDACHLLGMVARHNRNGKEALSWMTKAAATRRSDILNDFGLVLMEQQELAAALGQFELAIRENPRMALLHFNKGLALRAMGQTAAALDSFRTALACDPGFSKAHFCIGDLLLNLGNLDAASDHFSAAIQINPDYIAAYNHLAICLTRQHCLDDAVECLTNAHERNPHCADTLCNLGNLMRKKGRYAEAAHMYRAAIARRGNFIEAHFNLALVLLIMENFEDGWQEYEWRLKHFDTASGYPCRHQLPLWTGQPLAGKGILIYDEQGFGDVFMFCRLLKNLKAMQATVVFEVRKALFECFKDFPWADEVVLRGPDLKPAISCDYCLPLLSLPQRLGLTRENIEYQGAYLAARRDRIEHWSRRITGGGLKVGLAWSGSDADPARRLDIQQLTPLSEVAGISWYGLQKAKPGALTLDQEISWLDPLGPLLDDFTDTAAVIVNLDLVISIDTAVAHLAGALGKPVWVLLPFIPDWRWFMDTSQSPWYPSMRLFRQSEPDTWQAAVANICSSLRSLQDSFLLNLEEPVPLDALLSEAAAYGRKGERHRARSTYRRILEAHPDCYPAFFGLGRLFMESGNYREAIVAFEQAAAIAPGDHLSLNNLGLCYHYSGQLDEAETCFEAAVTRRPDYITSYCNLGNLYLDRNDLKTTIQWYLRALELNPDDLQAQCEMGKLYLKTLDLPNAQTHFEKAIALDPQCAEAGISLATTMLMQGDLANGWKYYRNRFKYRSSRQQAYPFHYRLPLWHGETFTDKRLIVHAEQGFGDTIQFARFLPAVKARGGQVIFQIQPPLMPLFKDFSDLVVLEMLPQIPPENPDADLCVPLMDLPSCLGVTLETLPAPQRYLTADAKKKAAWRRRIPAGQFNVGIVWAGNPNHTNDRQRSCPLSELSILAGLEHAHFFSLQRDLSPADASILESERRVVHLGTDLTDFAETAAAIACLDLVISVDTAVAHLAGAMAKPVWLLLPHLPDWRWMLHRTDTPWYATMHLFRQHQAGKWSTVIDAVNRQLRNWPCRKI